MLGEGIVIANTKSMCLIDFHVLLHYELYMVAYMYNNELFVFRMDGAGAAGADTFYPEPEPPEYFTWSLGRGSSPNSQIGTAPHPWYLYTTQ